MLLGGVPGVDPAKVVVLGGGVVGRHACHIALGMGADTSVFDKNVDVLRSLWSSSTARSTPSTPRSMPSSAISPTLTCDRRRADPGAAAPKLITRELVKKMKPGSVIVDVAIDQGGCAETSHATTYDDPVYVVDGVIHYCVANMPGGVPKTSTYALNNCTLPFIIQLADKGWREACAANPHLLAGLNVHAGRVTYKAVAEDLGYDFLDPKVA